MLELEPISRAGYNRLMEELEVMSAGHREHWILIFCCMAMR